MNKPTISDAMLGLKVRTLHPDLAEELLKSPRLKDAQLVPEIFNRVSEIDITGNRYAFNKTHLIVAVILHLYDPDVLEGWKRNLCRGVRSQLSACFDVCDTAISNNIMTVKNYYLTYRKFKEKVDLISDEIAEHYKSS